MDRVYVRLGYEAWNPPTWFRIFVAGSGALVRLVGLVCVLLAIACALVTLLLIAIAIESTFYQPGWNGYATAACVAAGASLFLWFGGGLYLRAALTAEDSCARDGTLVVVRNGEVILPRDFARRCPNHVVTPWNVIVNGRPRFAYPQ